jgi:hypothetical protein
VNAWALCLSLAAAAGPTEAPEPEPVEEGYTPESTNAADALQLHGYIDVGFAKAQGNGTSFGRDQRLPADYGVDTFATAVNSRGDVASTNSNGLFVNGFLPHSVGIGGNASFLINTVSQDILYTMPNLPVMFFGRLQFLPRFYSSGDSSSLLVEQAFGRITPFSGQEFQISVGKFDSVFGIEYLDNEAVIRTGITPSLIARYTTGWSVGIKVLYRIELPSIQSNISINAAATNSGTLVDSLVGPDASIVGAPLGSARLGYELNLAHVQLKLGVSGLYGPRPDQQDPAVTMWILGADARLTLFGLALAAEGVDVYEEAGDTPGKVTGLGTFFLASGFRARGFYVTASYPIDIGLKWLNKVVPYVSFGERYAQFEGFTFILTDRITVGIQLRVNESLAVKAEYLVNGELQGAPTVPNNVFTSSAVFSW